jgi:hypothetical protein
MVTTERACISNRYGKINKQNHHPKCLDMSFEKKVSERESKTFVCPHGYFRNYSSNFDKNNPTWSLDENLSIIYFISYSSLSLSLSHTHTHTHTHTYIYIYITIFLQNIDTS